MLLALHTRALGSLCHCRIYRKGGSLCRNVADGDAGTDMLRSIPGSGVLGMLLPDLGARTWNVAAHDDKGGAVGKLGKV